jgi:hypothetical protein
MAEAKKSTEGGGKVDLTCPCCGADLEPHLRTLWARYMRGRTTNKAGASRFDNMSAAQRSKEASKAAKARWGDRSDK